MLFHTTKIFPERFKNMSIISRQKPHTGRPRQCPGYWSEPTLFTFFCCYKMITIDKALRHNKNSLLIRVNTKPVCYIRYSLFMLIVTQRKVSFQCLSLLITWKRIIVSYFYQCRHTPKTIGNESMKHESNYYSLTIRECCTAGNQKWKEAVECLWH